MSRSAYGLVPKLRLEDVVRDRLVLAALPQRSGMPKALRAFGARDVLLLDRHAGEVPARHDDHVWARFDRLSDIGRNNCAVAILNAVSTWGLLNKRNIVRFDTILVPLDASLLAAGVAILRHASRRRLSIAGLCDMSVGGRSQTHLVLKCSVKMRNNARLYGPTGASPLQILQMLAGLDYVLLRWIEDVEADCHKGDLDILVTSDSLSELKARLNRQVGTYPLDVYTERGELGHQYKNVPYFLPGMAQEILATAVVRASGIRVPSPRWRYLSYCYHLLFQKSEKTAAGQQRIEKTTFGNSKHYDELGRLAAALSEPAPQSFDDLERVLKDASAFPPLDTIGFYKSGNAFLRHRYSQFSEKKPGLCVFFMREYGNSLALVPQVRDRLAAKFAVLAEGPLTPANEMAVLRKVRGGNWLNDGGYDGIAKPIYWFVCWDRTPLKPSRDARRRYPQLDNQNNLIKAEIRREFERAGITQRLHCSDNTLEALEYVAQLGIAERPEVRRVIEILEDAGRSGPTDAVAAAESGRW
jgi:hypothetical protein